MAAQAAVVMESFGTLEILKTKFRSLYGRRWRPGLRPRRDPSRSRNVDAVNLSEALLPERKEKAPEVVRPTRVRVVEAVSLAEALLRENKEKVPEVVRPFRAHIRTEDANSLAKELDRYINGKEKGENATLNISVHGAEILKILVGRHLTAAERRRAKPARGAKP